MAKAKKKETLSLEEKLEQALVPVDEQPYEVPENWCWVTVGNIVDLHRGVSYKKNEGHSVKEENDCLVMRGGNILEGAIDVEADNIYVDKSLIKTEQYVRENDIIIVSSTGSTKVIGRAGISYADYDDVSFGAFLTLVRPKEQINKRYVDYYFQSQIYRERIRSLASGVNINNIRTEYITNSPIPLPPLAEQQRIVEQIENLFSKLDEAKEKAQDVVDRFEERRVAIIHKAFEGVLTRAWRTANDISYESWQKISLKDCGRWFGGGTPTTSVDAYWENGDIPWITSKDMKDRIIEDSLMHITMTGVENSSANYCDEPAVLFVMRSGILRRVFPVCMVKRPFTVNQDLKACVPNINQEYLYWVCTGYEKDIRENCMKSGTTVESVEAKKLMDYKIPVATPEEQIEVVNQIEKLINKEEAAKEAAESVIDSIELMKKSILAKAFRGELGTNIENEESSIELLKSIIEA
ncbi:MAG: restriction endonuclease subunit S [Lachnospiraceae bacterium]|nr:restriction endonuclease subunit S [Lachnospiraceae bacterium]